MKASSINNGLICGENQKAWTADFSIYICIRNAYRRRAANQWAIMVIGFMSENHPKSFSACETTKKNDSIVMWRIRRVWQDEEHL